MLFCLMWHNFVALCAIIQLKMTSFSRHIPMVNHINFLLCKQCCDNLL